MPFNNALAGRIGMTSYATLKHLADKMTTIATSKRKRLRKESVYDSSTSDNEVITKQQHQLKKKNKKEWMTLDRIDLDMYWKRKCVGWGDILTQFNSQVPVIEEKSQYSDPTISEFKQRGPQRLG